jgi:TolA-binding protein
LLSGLLDAPEPSVPQDQTLLQIGRIYQDAGRLEEAREQWQRIVDEYPTGTAAGQARQLLAS